jgi:serine/threonine protein phosphatase PrpC
MPGQIVPANNNALSDQKENVPVVGSKSTAEQKAITNYQQDLHELTSPCQGVDDVSLASLGHDLGKLVDAALDSGSDTEEFGTQWFTDPGTTEIDRTSLSLGRAVDNYHHHKGQEDRDCAMSFPALSAAEATQFLEQSISRIDTHTRCNASGSTLTGVIVTETGDVVTAHLGDSPVSALIIGKDGGLKQVFKLTEDHKPSLEQISGIAHDGTTFHDFDGRRYVVGTGSINMTRAIGDRPFGGALNHEPEIKTHRIQEQLTPGDRLLLLVTTDGAHNEYVGITHSEHAKTIQRGLAENLPLNKIARAIANESADIQDNVTVLLLEVEAGKGALLGVFDGHSGSQTSQQARSLLERYATDFTRKRQH